MFKNGRTNAQRIFTKYNPIVPASKIFHVHDINQSNDNLHYLHTITRSETAVRPHIQAVKFKNPLVLIFADAQIRVDVLQLAQGCRRRAYLDAGALHKHLLKEMYPIEEDACIYAPDAPLIDLSCKTLSFIACPGIKMPSLDQSESRLSYNDELLLRKKVELICQVACQHGHKDLVLGALGCGVWGCPPRHVAEVFKNILQKYELRNITFAVLGANYNIFKDVFSKT